jgi:hypothetical protein
MANTLATEALIDDIEFDKKVALKSLQRPGYQAYADEARFASIFAERVVGE